MFFLLLLLVCKTFLNTTPSIIISLFTTKLEKNWSRETSGCFSNRCGSLYRVRKYAKFGVFYAKIVQMTPLRLRRESLWLQKFLVTNREPLWLQKFLVTNTVLSLPFLQRIQFTLIVNVVNLNIKSSKLKNYTVWQNRKRVNYDWSLLDDRHHRHHGFELSRSADHHS